MDRHDRQAEQWNRQNERLAWYLYKWARGRQAQTHEMDVGGRQLAIRFPAGGVVAANGDSECEAPGAA